MAQGSPNAAIVVDFGGTATAVGAKDDGAAAALANDVRRVADEALHIGTGTAVVLQDQHAQLQCLAAQRVSLDAKHISLVSHGLLV